MSYQQVADDVFLINGTDVNMVLLRDGRDLTLIDAGWYGDAARIEAVLDKLGHRPQDINAILLTHAHLDHVGAINHLHAYGIPAYTSAAEVPHAKGEVHESATPLDVIQRALKDRAALGWALRITRAGGLRKNAVPHIQPFPNEGPLDLPGHPVPISTAGHTSGHTVFHLPEVGAVATGDALVTAHPVSKIEGPQLLPLFFHHNVESAKAALDALEPLDAATVLPGHGPIYTGGIGKAVIEARAAVQV
ncbi:MBL fold metallo-hydrolase [Nocardia camponoti]|uniref:MBL fold metallo-hydrolase n=1 Tax=Nocardia camponoti TaxID=1616106 RepID=A0A917QK91_9NOCA|nr:MBL fold metallo-hydrolase [Nocardia camponoti]GGK54391.1 MBL fold metallo-hydrolase [Nocardia camponoti]